MNDDLLRTAYAGLLEERGGRDVECVSPESLLAIVDGTASEPDRLRVLVHVGRCGHCRADLDLLLGAHDAATQAVLTVPWHRRPWLRAAAGVVLILGAYALWRVNQPSNIPRGAGAADVQLLEPRDDAAVSLPVTLVWSAAAGARRYEVELLRPDGSVVFEATTADTVLLVPADPALAPGTAYRWWVSAVLLEGTRRSATRRLRIAP